MSLGCVLLLNILFHESLFELLIGLIHDIEFLGQTFIPRRITHSGCILIFLIILQFLFGISCVISTDIAFQFPFIFLQKACHDLAYQGVELWFQDTLLQIIRGDDFFLGSVICDLLKSLVGRIHINSQDTFENC